MRLLPPEFGHAGVDEAGRGPLAGPVSAAAVMLHPDFIPEGLNDSKKLNAKQRDVIFNDILRHALSVSVAFSCNHEIDAINIRQATLFAMRRAVEGLTCAPRHVWIDGRDIPKGLAVRASAVIGGDALHASIAAASIVAKVMRDRKMRVLDHYYPAYGFGAHKGYGTRVHLQALAKYGPCPLHRNSFSPVHAARLRFG